MPTRLTPKQRQTLLDAANSKNGKVSYIPGMGFHQPRTLLVLFRLGLLDDLGGWVGRITPAGRTSIGR